MSIFRTLWQHQRVLMVICLWHVVMIPVVLLLYLIYPVDITGVNGWVKPLKFALSSAVYAGSIAWIATLLPATSRWYKLAGWIIAVSLLIETSLITLQVARGTVSHYNISTPLDTAIYSMMATFISMLATANIVILCVVFFQKTRSPVIRIACTWGLAIAVVGMVAGVLMTSVNVSPSQLHTMQVDHKAPTSYGAHSVGVDDGGPGLPFVGWSTVGGDLRVGHFVGLHGLQVLPVFALLLNNGMFSRLNTPDQHTQLVQLLGIAYTACTVLLIWQAWRGQSVVSPDMLSMSYAAGIGVFALFGVWSILRRRAVPPRPR